MKITTVHTILTWFAVALLSTACTGKLESSGSSSDQAAMQAGSGQAPNHSGGTGGSTGGGTGGTPGGGTGSGGGTAIPTSTSLWSDPSTWPSGHVPIANEPVTIAAGQNIALDVSTAALGPLHIAGSLTFQNRDLNLTAHSIHIMNGGALRIGSESQHFANRAVITLTGPRPTPIQRTIDNGFDNDGMSRALMVMPGGILSLYGAVPQVITTKISNHAAAGTYTLDLVDSVNWRAGDQIAIAPTDFYEVGHTEILTLAQDANGNQVTLTSPLEKLHWGVLQYPTDITVGGNAMSLTPGPFTPASANTPTVLDERAKVILLTRNIVIQGADDADWATYKFGAHTMVMGLDSTYQIFGVRLLRVGQMRFMGRYPLHFHILSYLASTGDYLGDVDASRFFIRNSVVTDSSNRGITVHGTCGVPVENNFVVGAMGATIFLEDGSEERNIFRGNVVLAVGPAPQGQHIKAFEQFYSRIPAFWITNPNNTFEDNHAADIRGTGFWFSIAHRVFGQSFRAQNPNGTPIVPDSLKPLAFHRNVGHSNSSEAFLTDLAIVDDAGNVEPTVPVGHGWADPFEMVENVMYKNEEGYRNRSVGAIYRGWRAADNKRISFVGSSGQSVIRDTLLIARSLNDLTPFTTPGINGLASYHLAVNFENLTFVNYTYSPPVQDNHLIITGGAIRWEDFYVTGVVLGLIRTNNIRFINSWPGFSRSPQFDGFPIPYGTNTFRYWTLAGAYLDTHGWWGPADNYVVANLPFYTHGLSPTQLIPADPVGGQLAVSVDHTFYGSTSMGYDADDYNMWASSYKSLAVDRLTTNGSQMPSYPSGVLATQDIPRQLPGGFFPMMRMTTFSKDGQYVLRFPNETIPSQRLWFLVANGFRADDHFLLGIEWNGQVPVQGWLDSGWMDTRDFANNRSRLFVPVNTLAEVVNDTTGSKMYQDTAHNLVWINYRGGLAESAHQAWLRTNEPPWFDLSDDYRRWEHIVHLEAL